MDTAPENHDREIRQLYKQLIRSADGACRLADIGEHYRETYGIEICTRTMAYHIIAGSTPMEDQPIDRVDFPEPDSARLLLALQEASTEPEAGPACLWRQRCLTMQREHGIEIVIPKQATDEEYRTLYATALKLFQKKINLI